MTNTLNWGGDSLNGGWGTKTTGLLSGAAPLTFRHYVQIFVELMNPQSIVRQSLPSLIVIPTFQIADNPPRRCRASLLGATGFALFCGPRVMKRGRRCQRRNPMLAASATTIPLHACIRNFFYGEHFRSKSLPENGLRLNRRYSRHSGYSL